MFEYKNYWAIGAGSEIALGALYAAGSLPATARNEVFAAMRNSLVWGGEVDARFIAHVMGGEAASVIDLQAWNDPVAWALEILELETGGDPNKRVVQRRFRSLLREAHPDHGGVSDEAARRIAELTEARDILLAAS